MELAQDCVYFKFPLQPIYVMLLLLLSGLVALAALFLFSRKRARFIRLVDRIPGPPCYPFVGTELPFVLARRNSKCSRMRCLTRAMSTARAVDLFLMHFDTKLFVSATSTKLENTKSTTWYRMLPAVISEVF
jgi:hypothetical protein